MTEVWRRGKKPRYVRSGDPDPIREYPVEELDEFLIVGERPDRTRSRKVTQEQLDRAHAGVGKGPQ